MGHSHPYRGIQVRIGHRVQNGLAFQVARNEPPGTPAIFGKTDIWDLSVQVVQNGHLPDKVGKSGQNGHSILHHPGGYCELRATLVYLRAQVSSSVPDVTNPR